METAGGMAAKGLLCEGSGTAVAGQSAGRWQPNAAAVDLAAVLDRLYVGVLLELIVRGHVAEHDPERLRRGEHVLDRNRAVLEQLLCPAGGGEGGGEMPAWPWWHHTNGYGWRCNGGGLAAVLVSAAQNKPAVGAAWPTWRGPGPSCWRACCRSSCAAAYSAAPLQTAGGPAAERSRLAAEGLSAPAMCGEPAQREREREAE